MLMRRADRDRQIFEEHREPRELEPWKYPTTAHALADAAVTGFMRYMALAGRGVPLHLGMRTFTDRDAPWCILKPELKSEDEWDCPSCGAKVSVKANYCPDCDRKRPAGPEG